MAAATQIGSGGGSFSGTMTGTVDLDRPAGGGALQIIYTIKVEAGSGVQGTAGAASASNGHPVHVAQDGYPLIGPAATDDTTTTNLPTGSPPVQGPFNAILVQSAVMSAADMPIGSTVSVGWSPPGSWPFTPVGTITYDLVIVWVPAESETIVLQAGEALYSANIGHPFSTVPPETSPPYDECTWAGPGGYPTMPNPDSDTLCVAGYGLYSGGGFETVLPSASQGGSGTVGWAAGLVSAGTDVDPGIIAISEEIVVANYQFMVPESGSTAGGFHVWQKL